MARYDRANQTEVHHEKPSYLGSKYYDRTNHLHSDRGDRHYTWTELTLAIHLLSPFYRGRHLYLD